MGLILPRRRVLRAALAAPAIILPGLVRPARAAGASTWNPFNKSSNITLSASNFTAAGISTGGASSNVFSTTTKTTGKWYFEFNALSRDASGGSAMCIANALQSVSAGAGNVNSVFCQMSPPPAANGVVIYNGTTLGNGFNLTTNTGCALAVDLSALLIWVMSIPGGFWNSSATANPATGAGGYSLAGFTGPYFTMYSTFGATPADSCQVNFGATPFTNTPPAGFARWEPLATPGAGMLMGG